MPFEPNKSSALKLGTLRPAPLSYHSVSGTCWVLREDNVACQIHELAATFSERHKHRLLGPTGVVEVCIQIGAFNDRLQATIMQAPDGREISFTTTLDHLRLNPEYGHTMTVGTVYNGFQMKRRVREYVHVRVHELLRNKAIDHYAYSMTPCALFIGAGRKPIFLPFEVR